MNSLGMGERTARAIRKDDPAAVAADNENQAKRAGSEASGEAAQFAPVPAIGQNHVRLSGNRRDVVRTQSVGSIAPAAGVKAATPLSAVQSDEPTLEAVEVIEREQQAMLESAPVEQTYQETLALYVQAKHDQVERIEDRLENLIDRQQARLQQTQANVPSLLSLPSTKRAWQNQQAQQQARLQTLHTRLEAVREIKEGMGIHAPKVEELATRKMRAENPELAADWDAMREAGRRHQMMLRQKEKERSQAQEQRPGRSQSLGLTRPVS